MEAKVYVLILTEAQAAAIATAFPDLPPRAPDRADCDRAAGVAHPAGIAGEQARPGQPLVNTPFCDTLGIVGPCYLGFGHAPRCSTAAGAFYGLILSPVVV